MIAQDYVLEEEEMGSSGPFGDLYVDVKVKARGLFDRDEDDLFHEIHIPFTLSTLGGTIDAPRWMAR